MSITASRLGSAPIRIDWSNLTPSGEKRADPATLTAEAQVAWQKFRGRANSGEVGFYDTPIDPKLSLIEPTLKLASELRQSRRFSDVVCLGIGGSSLGPIVLHSALIDKTDPALRFHFLENPDPDEWSHTLQGLTPDRTLVVVIAKSGTTFETLAQFMTALEWLTPSRWTTHAVAVTDPVKGDLRAFAKEFSIPTLDIPASIGGRFSVFTSVGLFPAALAGIDVMSFLNGAKQVRDYCEKTPIEKNPLFLLGHELVRQTSKRSTHVCMPYASRLKRASAWFVQLWGESLGKDGKGFTPIAALGAVDQHSILQLLRDGPDDKVTWFITVDQFSANVTIPKLSALRGMASQRYPAFRILEGHRFSDLLTIEYRAIAKVLTRQNRANFVIQMDRVDERGLGALMFTLSVLTAFTGTLMGVDPFDQPGVEEGKVYIRESLVSAAQSGGEANSTATDAEDDNSPANRLRRGRENQRAYGENTDE